MSLCFFGPPIIKRTFLFLSFVFVFVLFLPFKGSFFYVFLVIKAFLNIRGLKSLEALITKEDGAPA
jgi:hypothetical protein